MVYGYSALWLMVIGVIVKAYSLLIKNYVVISSVN